MAKSVALDVQRREKTGSAESRRLRKQGLLPGNLYGHGADSQAFTVKEDQVRRLISEGTRIVDLQLDGTSEKAMVQDVQWDTFSAHVLHVDLLRVDATQRVTVDVNLEIRGVSPGTLAGGLLDQSLRSVTVECLALEIPEAIQVRVNELEIGDSIHVRDLDVPDTATLQTPEDALVVQVVAPVEVDEDAEAAEPGAIEPEVIGRKSDDEAEADG